MPYTIREEVEAWYYRSGENRDVPRWAFDYFLREKFTMQEKTWIVKRRNGNIEFYTDEAFCAMSNE